MSAKLAFTSLILGLLSFFYYNYNGAFLEKPLMAILLGAIALYLAWKQKAKGTLKIAAAGVVLGIAYLILVYVKMHG